MDSAKTYSVDYISMSLGDERHEKVIVKDYGDYIDIEDADTGEVLMTMTPVETALPPREDS